MLFEIQELRNEVAKQKPDNSEIVKLLNDLNEKFSSFELKPQINVESKEVKVEPRIEVHPTPVNIDTQEIVQEIKSLAEEIKNSEPNLETNKLLAGLIDKIDELDLKPEIKVESKEVKVDTESIVGEIKLLAGEIKGQKPNLQTDELLSELIDKVDKLDLRPRIKVESKDVKVEPIFNPKIEVLPTPVKIEKTDVKTPIGVLYKSLETLLSPFLSKVTSFIGSVLQYIKEPDRVVVTDYEISEYYGDKKVTYRIKEDNDKLEVVRES